ncbi:MAG: VWA domain-containing protein [Actinobacteria bacterium]|nr:VWA domain-containing protein [Actinomycetota bacterium]
MADGRTDLAVFARLLRAAGVPCGTGQVLTLVEAVDRLAPAAAADVYWAGRAALGIRPADVAAYDRVFRAWFLDEHPGSTTVSLDAPTDVAEASGPPDAGGGGTDEEAGEELVGAVASDLDVLRSRRFDRATDEELRAMRALMADLVLRVPRRRARRTEPDRHGRRPDLRRSMRRAVQTDGELVHRAWRRRRSRPRRLVLVLDVSGSMAGYARALLQFAFSARVTTPDVEVFAFGTRLTRLTPELSARDVDTAVASAAARVVDWDGGTRIGNSLATLNRRYGRQGLLRGAVVVVCSDGLERGDPAVLAGEAARLSRYAHRLVWVNPLKGDERYEPLARGMAVALPHVDRFVAGHDLASLEALADVVGGR